MFITPKAPGKQALSFLLPITQLVILWILSRISDYDISGAVWVLALFFIGMTHGSLDLLIIKKDTAKGSWTSLGKKVGWYLFLMLAAYICLMLIPMITVLLFFILTAVHFGEADRASFSEFFHDSPRIPKSLAWLRGSLVIFIPCFLFPTEAWMPFASITNISGGASVNLVLKWFSLGLIGLFFLTSIGDVVRSPKSILSQAFIFFLLESIIVIFWFMHTPPLLAIGGYFLCIHATRHMRVLMNQFYSASKKSAFLTQLKMHMDSLAFGIPAILVVVAWSFLLDHESLMMRLAYASIGFYLISTLPHHILVSKNSTSA
jgi:Brp/Blh family beta-carotene 15,15'-monooxygenase